MVVLKLKNLQSELENVENFKDPDLYLEQYMTSPHIAAHMLYHIEITYKEIEGCAVADLGCGTGMLSIAASLLRASYVIGVDIDSKALDVCRENLTESGLDNIDIVRMDVTQNLSLSTDHPWYQKFDTVIMNPPFGTKKVKGLDATFVKFGLLIARRSVYSMHKTTHVDAIKRMLEKEGVKVEQVTDINFDLPKTYNNHKKNLVDVPVQMLRFTRPTKQNK